MNLNDKWISPKDKLPEPKKGENVKIWVLTKEEPQCIQYGIYSYLYKRFDTHYEVFTKDEILAWCYVELPSLY